MSYQILSQKEYLLSELTQVLIELSDNQTYGDEKRSISTIEDIFLELVRSSMREIARNSVKEFNDPLDLLRQAFSECEEELKDRLKDKHYSTMHLPDFDQVAQKLKFPARELTVLSENLGKSRQDQKAGRRRWLQPQATSRENRVEIIEIGLQGSIDGLLARPLGAHCQLNFDRLGNSYTVSGDWFPFEISKGDFVFVVDDDGTIFISTENFPQGIFEGASKELEYLAQQVYTL